MTLSTPRVLRSVAGCMWRHVRSFPRGMRSVHLKRRQCNGDGDARREHRVDGEPERNRFRLAWFTQ